MATIQIYADVNMHNANTWYGSVVAATANKIVIVNGPLEGVYTGSFTYDAAGTVYGTRTGYDTIINGSTVLSVAGLNVNATHAQQLIQSDNLQPLFQTALSGNDQLAVAPGSHVIDGYGGYNTVYESGSFASYTYGSSNGAFLIGNSHTADALYNIGGVYFSDGFFNLRSGTFSSNSPSDGFAGRDMSADKPVTDAPVAYSGPVVGVQKDYIIITNDNLNVGVSGDNWFVHTDS